MDKLEMQTKNITEENIDFIESKFPNAITETQDENGKIVKKIDFDVLKQELSFDIADNEVEKYSLIWPGKKESILNANRRINKTLRPCKEESLDFDNTGNLYIEGDNLEVLKLLRETYLGKIKMIYIDPPYNTGNDFIYKDDFSESSDEYLKETGQINDAGYKMIQNTEANGRFHSDWLSMMYPRLKIAKDLLSDDGVIYISIDDNELYNLKKICDEVFGEANYINTICINMSNMSGPKIMHAINGKRFPKIKEYVLLYCKNNSMYNLNIPKISKAKWDPEYNLIIPEMTTELAKQIASLDEFDGKLSSFKLYTLNQYAKINNIVLSDEWKFDNAYRIFASKPNTALLKKALRYQFNGDVAILKNPSGENKLIKTDFNRNTRTARIELVSADINSETFFGDHWDDIVTTGGVGQEGNVPFPNGKKPLKMIKRILQTASNGDDIVLDFFSGSATTADAVLQLNAEDAGHRKFIMIQALENPSDDEIVSFLDSIDKPHYITEIGKERIRRAGQKILNENPSLKGKLDVGFRDFKLDESNMKEVYYSPEDYTQDLLANVEDNIKEDRTPSDLVFQVMLELGITLDSKIEEQIIRSKKVYVVKENTADEEPALICCFDPNVTEEVVIDIAKLKPLRVVFRDSSMKNDNVYINFDQIFETYSPGTKRRVL